jgi:hypothetical protein
MCGNGEAMCRFSRRISWTQGDGLRLQFGSHRLCLPGTVTTGQGAVATRRAATLPTKNRVSPVLPCCSDRHEMDRLGDVGAVLSP